MTILYISILFISILFISIVFFLYVFLYNFDIEFFDIGKAIKKTANKSISKSKDNIVKASQVTNTDEIAKQDNWNVVGDGIVKASQVTNTDEIAKQDNWNVVGDGIETGANEFIKEDNWDVVGNALETGANETGDGITDMANETGDGITDMANETGEWFKSTFDPQKCDNNNPQMNNFPNPAEDAELPEANPSQELHLTTEESLILDFIGPGYNYAAKIKTPQELGVKSSSDDSFNTIITNTKAMAKYTGYLISGPALGNNFFIKSGSCNNTSSTECKGKDRWIYVDNIPDKNNPCLKDIGISLPKGELSGLVPGLIDNIGSIAYAPIDIVGALATGTPKYSNTCTSYTNKVGPSDNLKQQTKCAPINMNNYKKCLPSF